MSFFTKLDAKDRSRQDISTVVAMTKVRQSVKRRPEHCASAKPRKGPILNWRAVDTLFAITPLTAELPSSPPTRAASPAPEDDDDDVIVIDDAATSDTASNGVSIPTPATPFSGDAVAVGLAALNEELETAVPAPHSVPSRAYRPEASGINLDAPFFADLLSERSVEGVEAISGIAGAPATAEKAKTRTGTRKLAVGQQKMRF
jgi:hypothetical protein